MVNKKIDEIKARLRPFVDLDELKRLLQQGGHEVLALYPLRAGGVMTVERISAEQLCIAHRDAKGGTLAQVPFGVGELTDIEMMLADAQAGPLNEG